MSAYCSSFTNINGVTCYMNSILSILQQTPLFSDWILSLDYKKNLLEKFDDDNIEDSILYQFYILFNTSLQNEYSSITPRSFRYCISNINSMWAENEQQDSQELLNFILNQIDEEISKDVLVIYGSNIISEKLPVQNNLLNLISQNQWTTMIKKEFSPIKMLFTGMYYNTIECTECCNISNRYELFQNVQLSILEQYKEMDIYTLLNEYTSEEQLDKNNMITCDFCGKKNKSKKKIYFEKLPSILILLIKRFKFNRFGIPSVKLTNHIDYPIYDLDLSKYVHKSNRKAVHKYNLFAVNLHHNLGTGINFGHYTSIVKNRVDKKWYHYNDENPVTEIKDVSHIINKDAYLLFYYKVNN